MSKYYYVAKVNGEIVGFHKKRKVVSIYLSNYKETNPDDFISMETMKKEDAEENVYFSDYYLEKCENTYIQNAYSYILELDFGYRERDLMIQTLERLLDHVTKKKEKKILLDILYRVCSNRDKYSRYTPKLSYLIERHWEYERYKSNIY